MRSLFSSWRFALLCAPIWIPPDSWGQGAAEEIEKPAVTNHAEEAARPAVKKSRAKSSSRNSHAGRVVIGNDLVLKADETAGTVVVIGGSADIQGKVLEDLVVIMGSTRLGPQAEVRHQLMILGGNLDVDSAAKIGKIRVLVGGRDHDFKNLAWLKWPSQWLNHGLMYGRVLPFQYGWSWGAAGVALLLYLVLSLLFPQSVQAAVNSLEDRPGRSLFTGMLAFVLFGPLLALLVITVVGMLAVPIALAAFVMALLFGKAAVYRYAGQQLGSQCGARFLQHPLLALVTGVVLFCALYAIPAVGLLAWLTVAPLGLGAVLLAVFARRRERPREGAAPTGVGGPPSIPALSAAEAPSLLPPAGFWLRFSANLLDLLLVGLVLTVLLHRPRWFLPTWLIYHLVCWSWRGTTVGGLLLGLSVVRLDGKPMNLPVALVRLFGACFSLAALGLGFLWAGWSSDKQSWHDRFSGTLVVKTPRPASRIATPAT